MPSLPSPFLSCSAILTLTQIKRNWWKFDDSSSRHRPSLTHTHTPPPRPRAGTRQARLLALPLPLATFRYLYSVVRQSMMRTIVPSSSSGCVVDLPVFSRFCLHFGRFAPRIAVSEYVVCTVLFGRQNVYCVVKIAMPLVLSETPVVAGLTATCMKVCTNHKSQSVVDEGFPLYSTAFLL